MFPFKFLVNYFEQENKIKYYFDLLFLKHKLTY